MAQEKTFRDLQITSSEIGIRKIGVNDLWHALKEGYDDFNAKPTIIIFLFVFYPLFAVVLSLFLIGQNMLHLAFPVISGLTLLGPVVLVWLFEMSRHLEQGTDVTWRSAFEFVHSSSFAPVVALSIVMMLLYVAWLYIAQLIYAGTIGAVHPTSISEFVNQVLTTRRGAALIFYGNLVGFVFAVIALSISVVSFPLVLDKPVSSMTAVTASIKAVVTNPLMIALWGVIVSVLLIAGTALFLVGLAAVLPILGHATWHLYRRLVEP